MYDGYDLVATKHVEKSCKILTKQKTAWFKVYNAVIVSCTVYSELNIVFV